MTESHWHYSLDRTTTCKRYNVINFIQFILPTGNTETTRKIENKHASYPDWRISPYPDPIGCIASSGWPDAASSSASLSYLAREWRLSNAFYQRFHCLTLTYRHVGIKSILDNVAINDV